MRVRLDAGRLSILASTPFHGAAAPAADEGFPLDKDEGGDSDGVKERTEKTLPEPP